MILIAVLAGHWASFPICFAQEFQSSRPLSAAFDLGITHAFDPLPISPLADGPLAGKLAVSPGNVQTASAVVQAECVQCQEETDDYRWLESVRVGYDHGFIIASTRKEHLDVGSLPFQMKVNGWGQLRHTILDSTGPGRDINQFQLKRGRLIFSGSAFTPDFAYFIQFDGRSSSGDNLRLLDFFLTYDLGHHSLGLKEGTIGFMTGKYKMPFTRSRYMSSQNFEFTDRSVASTFFDVNRSLAWGLFGKNDRFRVPLNWELAIFNGLVTGGAETGSSGNLDHNFAYSARLFTNISGEWGNGELADFEWHDRLATRVGTAFASSTIDRSGATEFASVRVVDSGVQLETLLPSTVNQYDVSLYAIDASAKYRGWSTTMEYYFRNLSGFGDPTVSNLFDHGFWLQIGKFIVPSRFQLLARWSRVVGDSGTLGVTNQSAEEISGGFAWYFRGQHAKFVGDLTFLDGAPINSSSLDIVPGERGMLFRTQIQFSF